MDIRALIKEEVLAQKAYAVEHDRLPVKLDANENPLAIPGTLRERFAARLASVPLNRYPEAGSPALAARFAKAFGVGRDQVIIGNGSDELIQILCTAVARPGAEVDDPGPHLCHVPDHRPEHRPPRSRRFRSTGRSISTSRPCGNGRRRSPPP